MRARLIIAVATVLLTSICSTARADHNNFSPCLAGHPGTSAPPQNTVVVQILSVRPNSDLEGDDDNVPFYDNKADIYGRVTIDGEVHDLPEISENDFPHWDEAVPDVQHPHGGMLMSTVAATPDPTGLTLLPVKISIEILEADSLLTASDDAVDINPAANATRLDFDFDICSLDVTGSVDESETSSRLVSAGSGDGAAEITFYVSLLDARPTTVEDAALVHLDLIQVVPNVSRLAAQKPTIVTALVANNYDVPITTKLELSFYVPGQPTVVEVFDLPVIEPGEVKKLYFFENNPILFPAADRPYRIAVVGRLDPEETLPEFDDAVLNDCRLDNNGGGRVFWEVHKMEVPNLLWEKVALDRDLFTYASDEALLQIMGVGEGFIRGTYPVAQLDNHQRTPFATTVIITPGIDWLRAFVPGTDSADPFLMVASLGVYAHLYGYDRIMGVVPRHDWFDQFEGWDTKSGVSLGRVLPRAVLFVPQKQAGPTMTLPAHELGHTFGLSVDSSIKSPLICSLDLPGDLGDLVCAVNRGFDEYKKDPPYKKGNPAHGYWIRHGGEVVQLFPFLNKEQCDAHCFMGTTSANDIVFSQWEGRGRWIDAADYDALFDALRLKPVTQINLELGTQLIYVSGLISIQGSYSVDGRTIDVPTTDMFVLDTAHLTDHSRVPVAPDVISQEDPVIGQVRFLSSDGELLDVQPIPANFLTVQGEEADAAVLVPVSAFGLTYRLPRRTTEIELLVVGDDNTFTPLRRIAVSPNPPEISLSAPMRNGNLIDLSWTGSDADGDELSYWVAISPDGGAHWWPMGQTFEGTMSIDASRLDADNYLAMVMVDDGVHLSRSEAQSFVVN